MRASLVLVVAMLLGKEKEEEGKRDMCQCCF